MTEMKTKMISLCLAAVMAISGGTTVIAADYADRQANLPDDKKTNIFSEMDDAQTTPWGTAPEFADTENGERPELRTASVLNLPTVRPRTASVLNLPTARLRTASVLNLPTVRPRTASSLNLPTARHPTASGLSFPREKSLTGRLPSRMRIPARICPDIFGRCWNS